MNNVYGMLCQEMLIGVPKYDYKDCTAYIIEKLRDNGFVVRYTHQTTYCLLVGNIGFQVM